MFGVGSAPPPGFAWDLVSWFFCGTPRPGCINLTQAGFLSYAKGADEVYNVSLKTWLHSRWTDTLNTLVPGYIFFVNASHPSYNPVGWMSDGWVHFWLQYWTAAPFAVGLATFFALAAPLLSMLRYGGNCG